MYLLVHPGGPDETGVRLPGLATITATAGDMVQISEVLVEEVTHLTEVYVPGVGALNSDPYFRDAVMRFAVRELAWGLLDKFGDGFALAEQLSTVADLVEGQGGGDDDRGRPWAPRGAAPVIPVTVSS